MKSKELRQKLGELTDASRKILNRAHEEQRKRTAEEEAELKRMDEDMDQLEADIKLADNQERRELSLTAPLAKPAARPVVVSETVDEAAAAEESQRNLERTFRERFGMTGYHIARRARNDNLAKREYRNAFDRWLISPKGSGVSSLTPEEQRSLSVGTNTEGGYTVPQEEFLAELIKEMDNQSIIRGISRTFQVTQAQSLGAPTLSADPSDPDWTTELDAGTEDSTMAFGKRELHPWPIAKYIKVSDKLLRASPLGMEGIVRQRLAYKLAVAHSTAFNTGDGANKPLGIYTPSASGIPTSRDVEIALAGVITPELLINARYTLRQGYWPNARWHFHRNWLREFRKIRTGASNDFMWQPGLTVGAPNTLLDFPYSVDEYAPSVTAVGAGVYAAVLGDFSHYWIVDALGIRIQRLDELFALTGQVAFLIRAETDASPVLADAFVRMKATAT